ncbi:transmembrane protein 165 isoform X2 [Teleopsis dalmanni]|uniref:transmembrane protein 165 isoform X2 n=1 Tax=Teleopsis dalmanni TaxID=139649 RepID=UPI000D32BB0A|nr:transmembrane protein 165 isoform X2 [Teleopsis dalmanni]
MSQNQSYFWHTTRRNVYLKRAAKLHMFLALIAVLTFSTICLADVAPKLDDDNNDIIGVQTNMAPFDKDSNNDNVFDAAKNSQNTDEAKDGKGKNGFVDAFTASISVILFTELGDKTFFIAAIMAMRHPRLIVFTGAISALALMTVLSVVFGMAATIIPKVYTYYISTALFAIFGLKMIYDGYKMKPGDAQEELEEVQSDLRKREDELERDVTATLVQDPESGVVRKASKKGATYLTLRVLMQAFTMTFLAEWGDRSQLTTIILAASKNVYGVTVGGIIGHSICTGLAVIGGRIVAAKISVRTVTIVGGIVFLGFALYALIVQPDDI